MSDLDLAQPEDRHDRAEWEAAAAAVLRKSGRLSDDDADALVWDKLTRTTLDGIGVTPLGTPDLLDDLRTSGRPDRQEAWDIRGYLPAGPGKQVNEEALVDLDGGVTSLWLQVGPDADLAVTLEGVLVDLAPVVLSATDDADVAARALLAWLEGRDAHPGTNLGVPAEQASKEIADAAWQAGILGFVVDATTVHDLGASDAQELGHALAVAAGYLRTLGDAGLDVPTAAALVEFRFAATDEQFTTIAKLRAARRLWARVQELCESEPVPMRLHAVTSRPMMTRYDPWVNMLRTTVAAFAAGVGGADAVTVLPFDSRLGRPDGFGRRIARNTSHLLIDEAHVAKVTDPAGGAYAVERLTDDLAVAAWEVFGSLESGESLDERIAGTVAARDQQVATRKRPLTGLTEFPNLGEVVPERAALDHPVDVRPYGAAFEELRDEPPAAHVFLATLGPIAQHTARATFASNLLAAGGIAVDVAGPTDGLEALTAAYDGQVVVCLAGSDAAYAEWGQAAADALRAAGAARVIIAGKPTDYSDDACAMGVDALAFLTRTREALA